MTGRPSRFRVGSMRHRIDVLTETTERDGRGQPVVTLAPWLTGEPAKLEDATGGETAQGRQVEATVTTIFTVRFREGYTRKHVVRFRGDTYGIVNIGRVAGVDRYLELQCRAVMK